MIKPLQLKMKTGLIFIITLIVGTCLASSSTSSTTTKLSHLVDIVMQTAQRHELFDARVIRVLKDASDSPFLERTLVTLVDTKGLAEMSEKEIVWYLTCLFDDGYRLTLHRKHWPALPESHMTSLQVLLEGLADVHDYPVALQANEFQSMLETYQSMLLEAELCLEGLKELRKSMGNPGIPLEKESVQHVIVSAKMYMLSHTDDLPNHFELSRKLTNNTHDCFEVCELITTMMNGDVQIKRRALMMQVIRLTGIANEKEAGVFVDGLVSWKDASEKVFKRLIMLVFDKKIINWYVSQVRTSGQSDTESSSQSVASVGSANHSNRQMQPQQGNRVHFQHEQQPNSSSRNNQHGSVQPAAQYGSASRNSNSTPVTHNQPSNAHEIKPYLPIQTAQHSSSSASSRSNKTRTSNMGNSNMNPGNQHENGHIAGHQNVTPSAPNRIIGNQPSHSVSHSQSSSRKNRTSPKSRANTKRHHIENSSSLSSKDFCTEAVCENVELDSTDRVKKLRFRTTITVKPRK